MNKRNLTNSWCMRWVICFVLLMVPMGACMADECAHLSRHGDEYNVFKCPDCGHIFGHVEKFIESGCVCELYEEDGMLVVWPVEGEGGLEWSVYSRPAWLSYRNRIKKVFFRDGIIFECVPYAFENCENLESVKFCVINVEFLNSQERLMGMFSGCTSLKSVDLGTLDTKKVYSYKEMFKGCSSLEHIDMSQFDLTGATEVTGMFEGCTSLETIDLSVFSSATKLNLASNLFKGCSSLQSVDLSAFSTGNLQNISSMFEGCSSLTRLTIDNFDMQKVGLSISMFDGCDVLDTLVLNSLPFLAEGTFDSHFNQAGKTVISQPDAHSVLYDGTNHLPTITQCNHYLQRVVNGEEVCAACGASSSSLYAGVQGECVWRITKRNLLVVLPADGKSGSLGDWGNGAPSWSAYSSEIKGIRIDGDVSAVTLNQAFAGCQNLTTAQLGSLHTEAVKDMRNVFSNCPKLTRLNINNFDMQQVTQATSMFEGCTSLDTLILSSVPYLKAGTFDTQFSGTGKYVAAEIDCHSTVYRGENHLPAVTQCNHYLRSGQAEGAKCYACGTAFGIRQAGTQGDCHWTIYADGVMILSGKPGHSASLGDWGSGYPAWYDYRNDIAQIRLADTISAVTLRYAFAHHDSLTAIDLQKLDTREVKDMSYMFCGYNQLTTLDLSSFNTAKVTDMRSMFSRAKGSATGAPFLNAIDLSSFNTSNVTDMSSMFYAQSKLLNLDLSHFNTAKVTDMSYMFHGCYGLGSLDVSHFNTENVTYMKRMFSACSSLKSLNLNSFHTDQVIRMDSMFFGCRSLSRLDLTHFNTSNVTQMNGMFLNCRSLNSLDLSHFDTRNVTDMCRMFDSCYVLVDLNISSFNTAKVTDMSGMFNGCRQLKSLTLTDFDMQQVKNSEEMFNQCNVRYLKLKSIPFLKDSTFNACTWDTVICELDEHSTIYRGENHLPAITQCNHYFYSRAEGKMTCDACGQEIAVSQTGTQGTCTWKMYANNVLMIAPTDGKSGELGNWDDKPSWSSVIGEVERVYFEGEITAGPTLCKAFYEGGKIKSIDFGQISTSDVTNMYFLFVNCASLTELDLSRFETDQVEDMYGMFLGCQNLQSLTIDAFNMNQVLNAGNMFDGAEKLDSLTLLSLPYLKNGTFNSWFEGKNVVCQLDKHSTLYTGTNYLPTITKCNHYFEENFYCPACKREEKNIASGTYLDRVSYYRTTSANVASMTYQRSLTASGWESWYVPFEVSVEALKARSIDAFAIDNLRNYDDDEDGQADRTVLELVRISGGTLSASTPYLIYVHDSLALNLPLSNVALQPASSGETIRIESATRSYTFGGTPILIEPSASLYTLRNGLLVNRQQVKANRVYMSVASKKNPYTETVSEAPVIRLLVVGDEDFETGIRTLYTRDAAYGECFDLNGRSKADGRGICVKRGKVIMVK